jgi:hypothetical protein
MIVDVTSITIKLSAEELAAFLIELNAPLRKAGYFLSDPLIVNYNQLCEACGRTDLIIY